MNYVVKEIFYTLQGEGAQSGRPAVFLRFSGCNLWSGREEDRNTAVCQFCDTDFVGTDGPEGGRYVNPEKLACAVAKRWPTDGTMRGKPLVVCTGGEPLLQLDLPLVKALHKQGFEIALETNGTVLPPPGIDWICVSPKAKTNLLVTQGQEIKLVFPQQDVDPKQYEHLDFEHFFLQPMDGLHIERNTRQAVDFCLAHPQWSISLQIHKILHLP